MSSNISFDTIAEEDHDVEQRETSTTPELDTLFTVLSNEFRHETLVALQREDESLSLSDLVGCLDGGTDQQIRTSLVHAHLPMLEEVQLVTWNRAQKSVEIDRIPGPYYGLLATIDRTA